MHIENSHDIFIQAERAALAVTPWDHWIALATKIAGHSLDGDEHIDGYSLDYAYIAFKAGHTAHEYSAATKESIALRKVRK